MRTTYVTVTLIAALSLAACGGEDRLTERELAGQLNPQVERIAREFGEVFRTLGRARETDVVPGNVRVRLRQAAAIERRVAEDFEDIAPPEDAEDDVEALAAAAARHADRLEQLSSDRRLTVARMADAIERGEIMAPLQRLAADSLVRLPGHQP
jgi:hypothetical protein